MNRVHLYDREIISHTRYERTCIDIKISQKDAQNPGPGPVIEKTWNFQEPGNLVACCASVATCVFQKHKATATLATATLATPHSNIESSIFFFFLSY